MEALQAFAANLETAPRWVQAWVQFMGVVLMLSVPFAFRRVEARVALVIAAITLPAMVWLYSKIGFVRLLGVVHVVLWTPFLFWLWRRRQEWRVKETIAGKWVVLLFATMVVSLAFDYADVARWLMGERGPM